MLAALVAFRDPSANLLALTVIFGIAAIVRGIIQIYSRFKAPAIPGFSPNLLLVMGIINLLFGLLLLSNIWTGVMVLATLFALWFTLESILGLSTAGQAKLISTGYYWFRIVFCIIGIVIGISLFLHPLSAALTLSFLVGMYFIIVAIYSFVEAFGARQ